MHIVCKLRLFRYELFAFLYNIYFFLYLYSIDLCIKMQIYSVLIYIQVFICILCRVICLLKLFCSNINARKY